MPAKTEFPSLIDVLSKDLVGRCVEVRCSTKTGEGTITTTIVSVADMPEEDGQQDFCIVLPVVTKGESMVLMLDEEIEPFCFKASDPTGNDPSTNWIIVRIL